MRRGLWASPLGRRRRWPSTPTSARAASSPRRQCSAPRGTRCTRRAPILYPLRCTTTTTTTTPTCTPRRPWRRRRRTAVDREKQPSEGAFSENNAENESSGDKPPIDPSKCLVSSNPLPPPPRRPPGSAGSPAFSRACVIAGNLLSWGQEPEVGVWDASDKAPSLESNEEPLAGLRERRRLLQRQGAGWARHFGPSQHWPPLSLAARAQDRDTLGHSSKAVQPREPFVRLDYL
nr:homeobox protein Hox-A9 isoform X2 [Saimiri boliviensis boliviensis]